VKLLDFSVAKLLEGDRMKTQAGVVFGTPQYMSPEQGRGLPLDARSDLYALGILAYEMLTGNVPFNDENPMTVIHMHMQGQIPPMPDSIPYSVQQIVRRALEKDPGRRYQSSGEMMQHCQQVFAELTSGNVSIGGGGVPRTVVAAGGMQGLAPQVPPGMMPGGMSQPGMMPQQQGMPPQQQGYVQANANQKTMMAQVSPFQQGQPQGGQPQQGGPQQGGPGGYMNAPPNQKTMVAGMAPPIGMPQGVHVPGAPPHMQPQGMGQPQGMMQPQGGGANKTVMLQQSEGVVSVARSGQALQAAAPDTGSDAAVQQGASALFWIMSMVIGIGLGVLAYVIVLQTQ
jgi:serine/threonine-protein kinase